MTRPVRLVEVPLGPPGATGPTGPIGPPGSGIPSMSADPVSPFAGQIWFNSTAQVVKFYNGTETIVLGTLDEITSPGADVSLAGHKLTGVADPTGAQDAATKAYTDTEVAAAQAAAEAYTDTQVAPRALDSTVVHNTGNETVAGAKTFSSAPAVPDASFSEAKVANLTTDLAGKVGKGSLYLVATDYTGVDPTGATDSTLGIRAAVADAASTGKPLFFPKGTYVLGTLGTSNIMVPLAAGITMFGPPGESATLRIAGSAPSWYAMFGTADDHVTPIDLSGLTIEHLTFDGNSANNAITSGNYQTLKTGFPRYLLTGWKGSRIAVRHCRFTGWDNENIIVLNGYFAGMSDVEIANNTGDNIGGPYFGVPNPRDHSSFYVDAIGVRVHHNRMTAVIVGATSASSAVCAYEIHGSDQIVADNHAWNYQVFGNVVSTVPSGPTGTSGYDWHDNYGWNLAIGIQIWPLVNTTDVHCHHNFFQLAIDQWNNNAGVSFPPYGFRLVSNNAGAAQLHRAEFDHNRIVYAPYTFSASYLSSSAPFQFTPSQGSALARGDINVHHNYAENCPSVFIMVGSFSTYSGLHIDDNRCRNLGTARVDPLDEAGILIFSGTSIADATFDRNVWIDDQGTRSIAYGLAIGVTGSPVPSFTNVQALNNSILNDDAGAVQLVRMNASLTLPISGSVTTWATPTAGSYTVASEVLELSTMTRRQQMVAPAGNTWGVKTALAEPPSTDNIVYVSPTGNDTNDGLTEVTALRTIGAALASSRHIVLVGSNYQLTGAVPLNALHDVVIEGRGPNLTQIVVNGDYDGFSLTGVCSRVTIKNLTVVSFATRAAGYGINAVGTSGTHSDTLRVENVRIQNTWGGWNLQYFDTALLSDVRYNQSIAAALGAAHVGTIDHCSGVNIVRPFVGVTAGSVATPYIATTNSTNVPVDNAGLATVADANTTATAADRVIGYTSLTSSRTVFLPAANVMNPGQALVVADYSNSASATNTITISPAGADTVIGSAVIASAGGSRRLISDGVSKWIVEEATRLRASANLSDVQSAATARTNISAAPLAGPFAPSSTGATAASRYVGATTSGAPTTGTFALGDFVIDQTGTVWICTTAGSPGTWSQIAVAGAAPTGTAGGDLTGTYPNPTLSTSGATAGSAGDDTHVPAVTVDAKGRVTAGPTATAIALGATGDATGTLPGALTLATANSAPGTTGDATHTSRVTTDAKGRVTANTATAIQIAESQVTNLTTDLAAKLAAASNLSDVANAATARSSLNVPGLDSNSLVAVSNLPAFLGLRVLPTGYWWCPPLATTTSNTRTDSQIHLRRIVIAKTVTIQSLAFELTVVGTASVALTRLGIHNVDATTGKPGTLILDLGTMDSGAVSRASSADGHTTSGLPSITSATAAFVSTDVGKPITGTGIPTGTTILSVASSTAATMTQSATATATTVTFTLGGGAGLYESFISGNQTLIPGTYFLSATPQGGPAVKPTYRCTTSIAFDYEQADTNGLNMTGGANSMGAYTKTGVSSTLGDLTGSSFSPSATVPVVVMKGA